MLALALIGCTTMDEQARIRRVWEMQDHETSYRQARDAIARGDLASAQQAGVDRAEPDPGPGLPPDATTHLAAVRTGGTALSRAATLDQAATQLASITADCAACHVGQSVSVPPLKDDAHELLWDALVFESEPTWQAGLAKLPEPGPLGAAATWPDRRAAIAAALPRR